MTWSTRSLSTSTTRRSNKTSGTAHRRVNAAPGHLSYGTAAGLLSNARSGARSRCGGDPQSLPQARAKAPPRLESGRQSGRGAVQEGPRSLRHFERCQKEADVRSVRLLFGKRSAWRRSGSWCAARAEHGVRRLRFFGRLPARGAGAGAGPRHSQAEESASFQDIFSQWFGRQPAEESPAPRKKARISSTG